MTRFLLALLFVTLTLGARELSELTPYLDLNTTEEFKSLVTSEDDANARRPDNNKTILMYAVWVGNEAAVEHLISKGADVNAKDSKGATPLLLAIFKDHTQIALSLIDHGADVNATADDGMTPILMSRVRKNEKVEAAILKQSPPNTKESQ